MSNEANEDVLTKRLFLSKNQMILNDSEFITFMEELNSEINSAAFFTDPITISAAATAVVGMYKLFEKGAKQY
ncbi:hypothetical protein [Limnovirga soli]|uniref:Uncharacterized protein n=1 Tax=Limnovirga soli TaxID=2656915 RepID=A0A8J8JSR0_9BACT|nr:hypothetical protein [Limnovirga soli]NNV55023.1 hypothetical protein [Limnovirga soli]